MIRGFFKVKQRPDVHGWHKLTVFLVLGLGEQAATFGYYVGVGLGSALIGTLFGVLIAWLPMKLALSYAHNQRPWPRHGGLIVGASVIAIAAYNWLLGHYGRLLLGLSYRANSHSSNQAALEAFTRDPWGLVFLAALTIVVAPVVEESMYRYLLITPQKTRHQWARAASAALLFGLAHMLNGEPSLRVWLYYFSGYAGLGAVLSFLYVRHHSLALNIGAHAAWNLLVFISPLL